MSTGRFSSVQVELQSSHRIHLCRAPAAFPSPSCCWKAEPSPAATPTCTEQPQLRQLHCPSSWERMEEQRFPAGGGSKDVPHPRQRPPVTPACPDPAQLLCPNPCTQGSLEVLGPFPPSPSLKEEARLGHGIPSTVKLEPCASSQCWVCYKDSTDKAAHGKEKGGCKGQLHEAAQFLSSGCSCSSWLSTHKSNPRDLQGSPALGDPAPQTHLDWH